mgnify:FL=1
MAEVAMSVMLLAGAGLLIRSFGRLTTVDPGFRTEGSVSFALSLPAARYPAGERQTVFITEVLDRLRALPGVDDVGAGLGLPLTGFRFNFSFSVAGRPPAPPGGEPAAEVRVATTDYFGTLGIPIVRGRGFLPTDRAGGQRVLLITEAAATRFFAGEDPIGRHVTFGWGRGDDQLEGDVVGVVGDTRQLSLSAMPLPQFWAPFEQWPVASVRVVVHGDREPGSLLADAQRVVHDLDQDLAVAQGRSLDSIVSESVAEPRFYMLLLAGFALVAVILSAVGIYGVIAFSVAQRVRELGIRMALGASQRRIVGMIVREGAVMAAAGLAAGSYSFRIRFITKPTTWRSTSVGFRQRY